MKYFISLVLAGCSLLSLHAVAGDSQAFCAREYFRQQSQTGDALGIAPSEAELIVANVARSISFQRKIKVLYCEHVERALAWRAHGETGIPDGNYIFINGRWLREVVGDDRVQVIALLGHELGHFTQGHFESGARLPKEEQEREADVSAGCAVARMTGDFTRLEDLLKRIRATQAVDGYPDRSTSIQAAREGYDNCGSGKQLHDKKHAALRVAARPDTVAIPAGEYRAVDYEFSEVNGVDVQVESEDTQWFYLDGEPIKPIERFGRILGGSFPVQASESGIYHNNIYLPPDIAALAKQRGTNVVQLRHQFNCRDQNENLIRVPATLKIAI